MDFIILMIREIIKPQKTFVNDEEIHRNNNKLEHSNASYLFISTHFINPASNVKSTANMSIFVEKDRTEKNFLFFEQTATHFTKNLFIT